MGVRSNGDHVVKDPQTHEEALGNLHTTLYDVVGEAVAAIAYMEKGWSQQELTKRIVRYIYNSAKSPDLMSVPWKEAVKKLVRHAMNGYCAACQEKPWFFEIDLAPAFSSAAWEILNVKRKPGLDFSVLEDLVVQEYEEILDQTLLEKAMWDATHATFSDRTVQNKVYNALHKAYRPALDECIVDSRPLEDLQRVEAFTKRWIDDSMRRAWCAVENAEQTITQGRVSRLFSNLVAPFGDQHEFSCIPMVLTDKIGRPPSDWNFIQAAVERLFEAWQQERAQLSGSSKRRKTGSGAVPSGEVAEPHHAAKVVSSSRKPSPLEDDIEDDLDSEGKGHPECTSAEDCIGYPDDRLVRHLLENEKGDVYCETCWGSFLGQNAQLNGVWEDGEEAGAPFASTARG